MLSTAHTAIGIALARLTPNEAAAAVTSIASHLLLDRIPHWGNVSTKTWKTVAVLDGITAATLAATAYATAARADRRRILAAVLGANLPDIDKPVHFFTGGHVFPVKIRRALERGQREAPQRIVVDITTTLIGLTLASTLRRHRN